MLYIIDMATTQDEPRKLIALRLRPSIHRQAKIAAVTAGVTLGQWLEAAIGEKVARERTEANNAD
jgi:predicted HicB family RNase H-like nuclease